MLTVLAVAYVYYLVLSLSILFFPPQCYTTNHCPWFDTMFFSVYLFSAYALGVWRPDTLLTV
jgi:hypothetical protein